MSKQIIYLYDTGWSVLTGDGTGTTISDYEKINDGNQFVLYSSSVGMSLGKAISANPSLAKQSSTKYYEEGQVQYNSVANRNFSISGVANINDSVSISTVSRTSNVATITTSSAHDLSTNDIVSINCTGDSTYNVTGVTVTVVNSTTFTYTSTNTFQCKC